MNYKQNYLDFIKTRKEKNRKKNDGNYYELHHILPRSLGGSDEAENLVLLKAREHYIAHYLLWKFTKTRQMAMALWFMSGKQKKIISSKQYEKLRLEITAYASKKVVCLETGEILTIQKAAILNGCSDTNIANACKGKAKTANGYHWVYFKEDVDYTKNKWYGQEQIKYFQGLIRLEDGKLYSTWKEAQKDNNVAAGSLSAALRFGGYCNGYHWDYFKEDVDYTKNKWYGQEQNLNSNFKKVVCLETGEIFDSQQSAARNVGLKKSGPIARSIKDKKATFAGYHWEYFEEDVDYTKNKWYGGIKTAGRPVVCLETGEIFKTLNDVERKYGVKACGLTDCLRGRQKTFAGYHWEEYDKDKNYLENPFFGKKRKKAHCKKIICLTNNKVFDSIKEAAKSINYNIGSFNAILSKGRRENKNVFIKGLEWSYYEN